MAGKAGNRSKGERQGKQLRKKRQNKLKVSFYGMTSCKGCYFQFLLLSERLLEVFDNIEVSNFWMLHEEGKHEPVDIAFMDGAVSNKANLDHVRQVRQNCKFLIAYGTCACTGGIPAIRNTARGYHKQVYGKPISIKPSPSVDPLCRHVKVDYRMFGCPINEVEAFSVIKDLLLGKVPREPDFPVCVDCKHAGIRCLFKDGIPCMGPVTTGGCGAPCPESRTGCDGCRGPLPDGNWAEESKLLLEHGITKEKMSQIFAKYAGSMKKCGVCR